MVDNFKFGFTWEKVMDWTIEIVGLFENKNVKIEMNKQINILIGENGIGKTTILRIVLCIVQRNFVDLAKYPFRELRISCDSEIVSILYEDLLPNIDTIMDLIESDLVYFHDNLGQCYDKFVSGIYEIEQQSKFYYALYLSRCFHSLPIGNRLQLHLNVNCYKGICPQLDPVEQIKLVMDQLAFKRNEDEFFLGSNSIDIIEKLNKLKLSKDILFLNMAKDFNLLNEKITKSNYFSPGLKWLSSHELSSYCPKLEDNQSIKVEDFLIFTKCTEDKFINTHNEFSFIQSEYFQMYKKLHEHLIIYPEHESASVSNVMKALNFQSPIDVNSIISTSMYNIKFIKKINDIAAKLSVEYLVNYKDLNGELDRTFFNEEVLSNTEDYLLPFLVVDTLLYDFIVQYIETEKSGYKNCCDYNQGVMNCFKKFYIDNIDSIKDSRDFKIIRLEELINAFSTNKIFRLMPSGIKVSIPNYEVYQNRFLDVYKNDSVEIKLSELSSGEKKVLILLLVSIFFDDGILLIDEPEISLSIVWQEELFPKILQNSKLKSILVATHSPFIASDTNLRQNLLMLPMED